MPIDMIIACHYRQPPHCIRRLGPPLLSRSFCLRCWGAGPGWPAIVDTLSTSAAPTILAALAAYHRRRFATFASCWVYAARLHIIRKALASGLL